MIPRKVEADALPVRGEEISLYKETNTVLECSDKRHEIVGIALVKPTNKPLLTVFIKRTNRQPFADLSTWECLPFKKFHLHSAARSEGKRSLSGSWLF